MGTDVQAGTLAGVNADGSEPDVEAPAAPVEAESDERKPTSPSRTYLVLLQDLTASEGDWFTIIGEVVSRNAQNALRKAARELRDQLGEEAVMLVVPRTHWRPTRVTLTVDERVSVSIGAVS